MTRPFRIGVAGLGTVGAEVVKRRRRYERHGELELDLEALPRPQENTALADTGVAGEEVAESA